MARSPCRIGYRLSEWLKDLACPLAQMWLVSILNELFRTACEAGDCNHAVMRLLKGQGCRRLWRQHEPGAVFDDGQNFVVIGFRQRRLARKAAQRVLLPRRQFRRRPLQNVFDRPQNRPPHNPGPLKGLSDLGTYHNHYAQHPIMRGNSGPRGGLSSTAASMLVAPCSPRGCFGERNEIRSGYKFEIVI